MLLILNVMLAVAWTSLNGEFSLANLAVGYAAGYGIIAALARGGVLPRGYTERVRAIASLAMFLASEFVVANVRMAADVVRPMSRLRPGIVRVPLDAQTDLELLALTTLLNLTPGTLALDVSDDRSALLVHVMHVSTPDEIRAQIKGGFERRVLRLFG